MASIVSLPEEEYNKEVEKMQFDACPQDAVAPQGWKLRWLNGGSEKSKCFGWAIEKDNKTIEGTCSIGTFVHAFKAKGLKMEDVCEQDDNGWLPSEKKFLMGFANGKMIVQLAEEEPAADPAVTEPMAAPMAAPMAKTIEELQAEIAALTEGK